MARGIFNKPGIIAKIRGGKGSGRGDFPHKSQASWDPDGQRTVAQHLGYEGQTWSVDDSNAREAQSTGFIMPGSPEDRFITRMNAASAQANGSSANDPLMTDQQQQHRTRTEDLMNSHHGEITQPRTR